MLLARDVEGDIFSRFNRNRLTRILAENDDIGAGDDSAERIFNIVRIRPVDALLVKFTILTDSM